MRNIPRQKITKSQRKIAREEERNKRTTKYSENNEQNSNSKSLPTINCFKGIWIKFSNQKMTEWGKKKNRSNCTLPIGDSLALKKYATILYIPFLKVKGWKKIF